MRLWKSAAIFCSLILSVHTQSVTYSKLPAAPTYADGSFSSPGGATQVYTTGATLNVTWESKYDSVNLYLIQGGNFATPISVAVNYAPSWYQWTVDGGNNLTAPFLFRVVNATGTNAQQRNGGFDSAEFWIAPNAALASSSSVTTTSSLSSTTLTSASSPITSPATMTTTSSTTSAASATSTSSSSPTAAASASGLSAGTKAGLGAGIGVGVGIAAIVGAALFFFWRRSQKKKAMGNNLASNTTSQNGGIDQGYDMGYTGQSGFKDYPQYAHFQQGEHYAPSELQGNEHRPPVEVPGWTGPQELPGNYDPKAGKP